QWVIEFQRHHGVPGFAQGPDPCGIAVVAVGEGEPDEEPVVAIDLGWSQRFVGNRHQPLPFFAGALRDQLLRPEAKTVQWRRREEKDSSDASLCRVVRKRGLRVGDGDELAAVTSRSLEEVSIV